MLLTIPLGHRLHGVVRHDNQFDESTIYHLEWPYLSCKSVITARVILQQFFFPIFEKTAIDPRDFETMSNVMQIQYSEGPQLPDQWTTICNYFPEWFHSKPGL